MAALSQSLTGRLLLLFTTLLAGVMVCLGLSLMLDVPHVPVAGLPGRVFGSILVAPGVFLFALIAGSCFPLAHPRVRITFEMIPWMFLGAVLLGEWA